MGSTKNPFGLSRDPKNETTLRFGSVNVNTTTGLTTAVPTDKRYGIDVKNWSAIHCVWAMDEQSVVGDVKHYLRVRPFRFYTQVPGETFGVLDGHWIADNDIIIPLNEEAKDTQHSQQHKFETLDADKMYFKFVEVFTEDPAGNAVDCEWINLTVYGYIPRDATRDAPGAKVPA